jgi:hypothetical protein
LTHHRQPDTPAALEVYCGGFGGASYGTWWDGEHLIYESFAESYSALEQTRIAPSAAQWQRFWRTIEQLNVWEWALRDEPGERRERTAVTDGIYWSVTLEHAGRRIESSGAAGPGATAPDEGRGFAGLLDALSRLLGGRAFS